MPSVPRIVLVIIAAMVAGMGAAFTLDALLGRH
jgi:hypothetical protein